MFPVKIGNEVDVKAYSESLIKGEQQLLVTVEGNIFITNGDGTHSEFKGNNAREHILALVKIIEELDLNKSDITHKHDDYYYTKGQINKVMEEVDKTDEEIYEKIGVINNKIVDINSNISDLNDDLDGTVNDLNDRIDRDFDSIVQTIDGVKEELNSLEKLATSISKELQEYIKVTKNAIDRIDKNLLTLSDDIANLSNELNSEIDNLSKKVYTKEEIDAMNIPASRITVDVTENGITTNMTMQNAIDILFSRKPDIPIPPKPTGSKCGTFKAGKVKCGQGPTDEKKKPVCGNFKSGKVKCGNSTVTPQDKSTCGTFKAGKIKCGQ